MKSKFAGRRNIDRRGGKRKLSASNLDRDLENYWKGKDQEKQEIYKSKLDQDWENYFKSG